MHADNNAAPALLSWNQSPPQAPPPAPEPEARHGFSGRDLLRLIFKYRWVVLLSFAVVSALSVYAALQQPTLYTASAQVAVKTDQQQGTSSFLAGVTQQAQQIQIDPPSRRIETEMSALLNVTNIERVIKEHKLTPEVLKRSPLAVTMDALDPHIKALRQLLGVPAKAEPAGPGDDISDTVGAFLKSASADPVRSRGADVTSNVIEITLTGTDRERTQAALASLVAHYVERSSSRDRDLGRLAASALAAQTADAALKLAQADEAVVKYALRPGATAQAANQAARSAESINARLRADMETLQTRLDVLRQTYGEQYTEVRTTRAALDQLRARQLAQSQDFTRSDANLGVLERRRALQETRFVELQRKLDQVNLYLALSPTEIEGRLTTEMPRRAEKVGSLGKLVMFVSGPIVGLLLGLALASAFDILDRRLQTRNAVNRFLGLETLGTVPEMKVRSSMLPASLAPAMPTYYTKLADTSPDKAGNTISFDKNGNPNLGEPKA